MAVFLLGLAIGTARAEQPEPTANSAEQPLPAAAGQTPAPDGENNPPHSITNVYDDVALLTEAMLLVRHFYVDELEYRDIVYSALHGMLSHLDTHSDFLEPEQTNEIKEDTEASFAGIGIEIDTREGRPVVIAPIEDSPAQAAGLMSGDVITAINGKATFNLSLSQIVKKLRGPPDTKVTITIGRGMEDPFDVTLIRKKIQLSVVKGVKMLPNGIGYLRITQFSEPTVDEVVKALAKLQTNTLNGLILDLRDNPGGLLEQAVAVSSLFLKAKKTIVTTKARPGGASDQTYLANATKENLSIPLAVLINRGSASASEIVAGALQDHGRAVVIGERSFGKASVQRILPLETREGCSLKITTAHYYTPKGRLIHETGIEPDIEIPVSLSTWQKIRLKRAYDERPEAYPQNERIDVGDVHDIQLQRASDVLVGIHIYHGSGKP